MTMWDSAITIAGTLAGVVTAGVLQQRGARAERVERWAEQRRDDRLKAVTALLVALADHRRTMHHREELRLTGKGDTEAWAAARVASHETRSAVTAPHATLAILVPEVAEAAQRAVSAAYALRGVDSLSLLEGARQNALAAADDLLAAASTVV